MAIRTNGTSEILAYANNSNESFDQSDKFIYEAQPIDSNGDDDNSPKSEIGCGVMPLPERLQFKAAEVAARVNPVNAPVFGRTSAVIEGVMPTPLAAAVSTAKYWGPKPRRLTVSFMGNYPTVLRTRIVSHLNAWTRTGCIEFVETEGTGMVRISLGPGGYWSYLGTDILLIPQNRPTMNLQGFSMNTSESEYRRVVRHEAGHTLGMPHEHMRRVLVDRLDPEKAYQYFLRTQGWDRTTVDQQVLTALEEATLMGTPADQDSIMCYQLPASITRDGQPIRGGIDINPNDYAFIGQIYPRQATSAQSFSLAEDWSDTEDVNIENVIAENSYV